MTRFIKAADPALMRLNLTLLLFVSFLPFTTAIAATHLFVSVLTLTQLIVGHAAAAERVAVVVFGLNLTLAALMVYLVIRHASRTPGVAADDMAEEELQAFARERRAAALLQAGATVMGVFLPVTAVIFYLALYASAYGAPPGQDETRPGPAAARHRLAVPGLFQAGRREGHRWFLTLS